MAALDLRHVGEAEVPEKPLAAERDHRATSCPSSQWAEGSGRPSS